MATDISSVIASETESILDRARTITGNNIKGSARIISLAELRGFVTSALDQYGGTDEEELKKREEALRAEFAERERALQERIRELESQNAQSEDDKKQAVDAARLDMQGQIDKLQTILDSDDARARAAFLEQEVARLQAMLDRYKSGLETITAVENPDVSDDLRICEQLSGSVQDELGIRVSDIKLGIEGSKRALDEGVSAIMDKEQGTIYSCLDLLEHSVAIRHYRHELRSIQQAL